MESLRGKHVLITGATGLVGGHLTERLLARGARIFATYRSINPASYFAKNKLHEKIVCAACDLKDFDRVQDCITKYEISHVFHLAAQPIVSTAYIHPREALMTNIMGTVNILEAARLSPMVRGVVVASSDKAYGKRCDNVTEDEPLAGNHPYEVSKSCADLIAQTYAKTYALPVAVSRFGNIYGPGDLNFNRIVPGVIETMFTGGQLQVRSDGRSVRDYVYVKDVVDGYVALMERIDECGGEAFNFGAGYNFSVIDLIQRIENISGMKCDYRIINTQQNEIFSQSLNFEKASARLGWKSAYSFEDGMKETFNWYKEHFV